MKSDIDPRNAFILKQPIYCHVNARMFFISSAFHTLETSLVLISTFCSICFSDTSFFFSSNIPKHIVSCHKCTVAYSWITLPNVSAWRKNNDTISTFVSFKNNRLQENFAFKYIHSRILTWPVLLGSVWFHTSVVQKRKRSKTSCIFFNKYRVWIFSSRSLFLDLKKNSGT